MAKSIDFIAKNVKPLSEWLKKFLIVEKSLLLEINEKNKCFTAKTYNEEKSVVKFSKLSFVDAGLTVQKKEEGAFVKVGIYSIQRLMKSFDHFTSGEFLLSFQYEELAEEGMCAGTSIILRNEQLKIKIECTSLGIFKYISDEMFTKKIANTNVVTSFRLNQLTIEKINSLCDLDKEYKFLEFLAKNNKLFLRGKSFELELAETTQDKYMISIYKEQFYKLDNDSYDVELGEEKIVYRSTNSDTICVNSMVVKDDKYEEVAEDF